MTGTSFARGAAQDPACLVKEVSLGDHFYKSPVYREWEFLYLTHLFSERHVILETLPCPFSSGFINLPTFLPKYKNEVWWNQIFTHLISKLKPVR